MSETVFIAFASVDYEGDDVIGVYASRDEAIERCRTVADNEKREHSGYRIRDEYSVSAWEVGGFMSDDTQSWYWRPEDDARPS